MSVTFLTDKDGENLQNQINANKIEVDGEWLQDSTNPVQSKLLAETFDTISNIYNEELASLQRQLEEGLIVDSSLSETSERPVQNRTIYPNITRALSQDETTKLSQKYNKKLYKIFENVQFIATTSYWDDLPKSGETFFIVTQPCPNNMILQVAYCVTAQGNGGMVQYRYISSQSTTGDAWHEVSLSTFADKIFVADEMGLFNKLDENNVIKNVENVLAVIGSDLVKCAKSGDDLADGLGKLLSTVVDNIIFSASATRWDDLPKNLGGELIGGVFINRQYTTNYKVQILIPTTKTSGIFFTRIIDVRDLSIFRDWKSGTEACLQYYDGNIANLSTYCRKKLYYVRDNIVISCSSSQWDDMPSSVGMVFANLRYSANYQLQLGIQVGTGNIWHRIVDRRATPDNTVNPIFRDWTNLEGIAPLKILALGDSICYGARNSKKGFVGDLGLLYKNIGIAGATLSNFETSVANIPNQLVSETAYIPDIIIANGGVNDYYKNVSLGSVSALPVSSDEEAEALDRSTLLGGLEYLFYKMISLHPKAQRFFLITHKTYATAYSGADHKSYWVTTPNQAGYTQQEMHDAIVKCCNAYNVKVIDIYNDSMINTLFPEYCSEIAYNTDNSITNSEYVDSDGIHPCAYGYKEGYIPIVRKAIHISTAK